MLQKFAVNPNSALLLRRVLSDMRRSLEMSYQSMPAALNCSTCSFLMSNAGRPPVLGNVDGTFLRSSAGKVSKTSNRFTRALSIADNSEKSVERLVRASAVAAEQILFFVNGWCQHER